LRRHSGVTILSQIEAVRSHSDKRAFLFKPGPGATQASLRRHSGVTILRRSKPFKPGDLFGRGLSALAHRLFIAPIDGGLPMSEYPELREFIEGFAERYARRTELGPALAVTDEELQALGEFLSQGFLEWVEASRSSDALDEPALGKFLEEFADRRSRASDVGA